MKQLTVNDLAEILNDLVKQGQGNKYIVLSDDTEGNGYHGMFYDAISDPAEVKDYVDDIYDSVTTDPDKLVILG